MRRPTQYEHLSKVSPNHQLKIPSALVKQMNIQKDDHIIWTYNPDTQSATVQVAQIQFQPKGDN